MSRTWVCARLRRPGKSEAAARSWYTFDATRRRVDRSDMASLLRGAHPNGRARLTNVPDRHGSLADDGEERATGAECCGRDEPPLAVHGGQVRPAADLPEIDSTAGGRGEPPTISGEGRRLKTDVRVRNSQRRYVLTPSEIVNNDLWAVRDGQEASIDAPGQIGSLNIDCGNGPPVRYLVKDERLSSESEAQRRE